MANRQQGYPSLTARKNWGKYAIGMIVEAVFILGVSALAFLIAIIATVIWS